MSPRRKTDAPTAPRRGGAAATAGGTTGDTAPAGPDGRPYTFEQALERLETIVDELENGTLSLEESLTRFEEGVRLSRFLEVELGRAQKRVEELIETSAGPATRPWGPDDAVDDETDELAPWGGGGDEDEDDEAHGD